jgi:DNA-binding transcriptional regulator YiaG
MGHLFNSKLREKQVTKSTELKTGAYCPTDKSEIFITRWGKLKQEVIVCLILKRINLNITQDNLNEHLGYSERLVSKWECRNRCPSEFALLCWATTLGFESLEDLIERSQELEIYYGNRPWIDGGSSNNKVRSSNYYGNKRYSSISRANQKTYMPLYAVFNN